MLITVPRQTLPTTPGVSLGYYQYAAQGAMTAWSAFKGKKGPEQRTASTVIVDTVEPYLQQNLAAYAASPRTLADQAAALKNFDDAWAAVTGPEGCGNSALGKPGQACVNDRKVGACTWKDAKDQCWNWFIGYRDPIAKDTPTDSTGVVQGSVTGTGVKTLTGSTGAGATTTASSLLSQYGPLILMAGAAVLLLVLQPGGGGTDDYARRYRTQRNAR